MKKKPTAQKTPARKKVPAAPKKQVGGAVTKTTTEATLSGKKRIDPAATVLLSDAEFSVEVIAALKREFGPTAILQSFRELLNATYENKHGQQQIDYRTRLAALEKMVHLVVGKPLDRIQHIETTVWSYEQIEELVRHSRALRDAMRDMLSPYDADDLSSPAPTGRKPRR